MLASAVTGIIFLAFGVPFSKSWGASGIAWATSIAFSAEMVLLFVILTRQMGRQLDLLPTLMRLLMGTLIGSLLTLVLLQFLPFPDWITAIIGMGSGFAVAVAFLFKDIKVVLLA